MHLQVHEKVPHGIRQRQAASHSAAGSRDALRWMLALVDDHDRYTGSHSRRVSSYADSISRVMGLAGAHIAMIRKAALLHDIGKVAIPQTVLRKEDVLDDQETAMVRLHPVLSASIITRVKGLQPLVPAILHHHEMWDGTGYPEGLAGNAIPLESRIILVADSFDAMTSIRTYTETRSPAEAMREIEKWSGQQFDPIVVAGARRTFDMGLLG